MSLDFLIEFTWEHNAWHTPTEEVVRSIIIPAVLSDQPHSDQPSSPSQACVSPVSSPVAGSRSLQPRSPGAPTKNRTTGAVPSDAEATRAAVPYTALLEPHQVGPPEIFVSHAWSNPFGLLVAACRKLVSDSDKLPRRDKSLPLYIWVDVFAVTQQAGEAQRCDLAGLEPTIARPECTTLVVLDAEAAVPLTRIWCIFEIYATILTANGRHGKLRVRSFPCASSLPRLWGLNTSDVARYAKCLLKIHCPSALAPVDIFIRQCLFHTPPQLTPLCGRLKVRVGSLSSTQLGEFEPCSDRDRLGELASQVEVTKAEATVAADKAMILSRLRDLGAEGRDGTHELNRKLIRAVRHGW